MSRVRTAGSVLLLAICVPVLATAQAESFDAVTSVVVIEVPVQVTQGGEPVRGLSESNFELVAGGKKQRILDFQRIDLSEIRGVPTAEQIGTLPVIARRHFLFLFDLSFANPAGVLRAQEAAHKLALEALHPTDLAGVAIYTESRGAEIVLGFTSDRRQVDVALSTLGQMNPNERVRDPLGIVMAEYKVIMEQFGGYEEDLESSIHPAGYAFIPGAQWLNNMKDMVSMSGRANRDQIRNQILSLSSSMGELADHLAAVDGRKYVVLFSEGFDSASLLGTDNTERIQELNKEASFGLLHRVDSDERYGDLGTQQGVFEMLDQFRRCDCTIQAVDIGGVRADGSFDSRPSGEQSLFVMADHTGGEYYRNYNDLGEAMGDMLERTSVSYLLSFQPRDVGEPGQYYPIRVKLKGAPKGARVVHRPGYSAPRPYVELAAEERRLQTAQLLMEGREGGALDLSVLAAPVKPGSGQTEVLTMVEIEGYSLLRGLQGNVIPTEVFAYAVDSRGAVADFLGHAISLDLEKVKPALESRGFKFLGRLQLAPGDYEVRVLVRNVLTGATGVRVAPVHVPAFDRSEAALLPPFFIEPEGSWLVGEEQRDDGVEYSYPLSAGGSRMIPAARPYLRIADQVPLVLVAHNLSRGDLQGGCRLVPIDGGDPVELALTLGRRGQTDVPGVEQLTASIGPGQVDPGEYRLEVSLRASASDVEVSSSIPVRIY